MTRLTDSTSSKTTLSFRFPTPTAGELDQDEEWCEVQIEGRWTRIRFHDYHRIYPIPGLYEALFDRRLKCTSPQRVVGLLDDVLADDDARNAEDLRVLEVGAGNGMVGAELQRLGVSCIVGVDILPEAQDAARRDRPDIYDDYLVADLTNLDDDETGRLRAAEPNVLCIVAALGYGDIPALAFVNACNLIDVGGYLVFNIKEEFLDRSDDAGEFSRLIDRLHRDELIQIQAYRRYCHRLSVHGEPLHYVAVVAKKMRHIPEGMADEA